VSGDHSTRGSGGTRPLRIRPHWWAVLAVSLSLLALVAATSGHPGGLDHHRTLAERSGSAPATTTTTTTPASTTTTVPGLGANPVSPAEATPGGAPALKAQIVTRPSTTQSSAPTPTTSTTTTTTAPPSGSTVATTPVQPAPVTSTGDLVYPDDSTATTTFFGVGAMRVTATWPTTPTVSLTVTCPGGGQSAQGSSMVTVLLPVTGGNCIVTLKELLVQFDAVNYTLTIAPAGG
jgi:hypothetical protein